MDSRDLAHHERTRGRAFGAAIDNPGLIVACGVGDRKAETGPLATALQSTEMLDPVTDGAVLPILHLNGFKISNPTVLARIEHDELEQFLRGCGWTPLFVEGDDPVQSHRLVAGALVEAVAMIHQAQRKAREHKGATPAVLHRDEGATLIAALMPLAR